jgi:enoyl-CoA hydratase/carnithine racemase
MGEFVSVTVTDRVATIRLDRPPMNAISMQVQDELRQAVADIGADPGIRAAVIYGGEKVFAAGVGVKEMASKDYPTMALARQPLHAAFTTIAKIPKPVVAPAGQGDRRACGRA